MKSLVVTISAKSSISQIPDSQKIFGCLMFLYSKYAKDRVEVEEFVRNVKNRSVELMVSSLMPKGCLPFPESYIKEKIGADKKISPVKKKDMVKSLKGIQYVPAETLCKVITNLTKDSSEKVIEGQIDNLKRRYIEVQYYPQQCAGIENLEDGIPILEPKLYSVSKSNVIERKKDGEAKEIKEFEFYVAYEEHAAMNRFIHVLKESSRNGEILLLGKRNSNSNFYQMNDCAEPDKMIPLRACRNACSIERSQSFAAPQGKNFRQETDCYLNLGKLLPDKIDYEKSYLDIYTSKRKPFHLDTAMNPGFEKYCFISFIKEGSILYLNNKEYIRAGKTIENPFNVGTVLFGNSFLYPIGGA